jgi:hypothetical protein
VSDLLAIAFAVALVGLVLFAVAYYLLAGPQGEDPPEDRPFDLEDFRTNREEDE